MSIPTLNRLRELKLGGMAHALQQQQEQPGPYAELSFTERLAMLVEQEHLYREQKKQSRLLQQAHLKLSATLQDIDYQHPRNVERSQIAQLAQSEWINRGQNLLITGPCGCLHGYSVHYYRLSRLLQALTEAKADGSYHKLLRQLARTRLLVLDDWGLEPLTQAHRNDLLEIMDDRHGQSSTVVISQLPTEQWYGSIGDNTLADAILDRLMHNAHRLQLKGESMRKRQDKLTQDEQSG